MITSIEGSCRFKEPYGGGQISISIAEKVILESKKRGISGIICAIGRLTIGKKVKSPEMSKELTVDYMFNQF